MGLNCRAHSPPYWLHTAVQPTKKIESLYRLIVLLASSVPSGPAQGFGFIKYEDQRSTILAVDNFNGIELLGRTVRVDHKHKYSLPAEVKHTSCGGPSWVFFAPNADAPFQ